MKKPPTEQDMKLYKYVSNKFRLGLLDIDVSSYESKIKSLCEQAVNDGLICEYKVVPTKAQAKLTINNGRDEVVGSFGIRLREDIEGRRYLVHVRVIEE
jgi:hypothetical protein